MFGFVCYNVLAGLLLRDVFPDPDVLCRYLKCNQKTAADWFLDLILMSLEGVEFHQAVEENAGTREEMISPVVEIVEKQLKLAVGNSMEEELEGLRRSEEEMEKRRERVAWLKKLASDWEYEERSRWKEETPTLNPSKKRSGIKRKALPRPGELKRLKMRSLRDGGVGSTAEESGGTSLDQPAPGSSGVRSDFREEVSKPQQEDDFEEVVILQGEDDVFLEEEEEKKVEVTIPRRQSAGLRFSRKVVERPPTYDELIEGVPQIAFPEDLYLELEVPWEERFF